MEDESCDTCMRDHVCNENGSKCADDSFEFYKPKVSARFQGRRQDHEGFAAEPIYTGDNPELAHAESAADQPVVTEKVKSDGSTASYYELPEGATELQDLISYKNMNSQLGEIFRACYRYGQVEHSEKMRDAKKIKFYIEAEIDRLKKYGD